MKYINKIQLKRSTMAIIFMISLILPTFLNAPQAWASEITAAKVIELTNGNRQAQGLNALTENAQLDRAAASKAADMEKEQYFSHTSPSGATPWHWFQKEGYAYQYAGENLAIHFTTAEDQQTAWMNSPSHRENILNPKYKEIGVAVRTITQKGEKVILTVQMFGAAPESLSTPIVESKNDVVRSSVEAWTSVNNNGIKQFVQSNLGGGSSSSMVSKLALSFAVLIIMIIIGIGFMSVLHGWETLYKVIMQRKKDMPVA